MSIVYLTKNKDKGVYICKNNKDIGEIPIMQDNKIIPYLKKMFPNRWNNTYLMISFIE